MTFPGVTEYLTETERHRRPGSKATELVLILHGWTASARVMKDVRAVVEGHAETNEAAAMPDADVLVPSYPASFRANTPAAAVAWDVVALLNAAVTAREKEGGGYQRILLIGHSCGALLVRKAVVFALGQTQDADLGISPRPMPWAHRIERVILFAGMNRGWQMVRRPKDAGFLRWWLLKCADVLSHGLPFGKFVRAFERGAPFLADLRVQWLRLAVANPAVLPVTVQLLGTRDDLVQESDNTDVEATPNFIYRILNGASHVNCVHLSPVKHPNHAA
ncbi:MAG: alpha/beta fold hydrolase, partial [Verrucomicrobiae bacterium]|nr:alpha/beta fold hydrolase [Verrucomicrobiae bacterium]